MIYDIKRYYKGNPIGFPFQIQVFSEKEMYKLKNDEENISITENFSSIISNSDNYDMIPFFSLNKKKKNLILNLIEIQFYVILKLFIQEILKILIIYRKIN